MRFPGFVNGSHASRSLLANAERTVNWYPENVGDRLVLYPTSGMKAWKATGHPRGRAAFTEGGRTFFVQGQTFLEVTANKDVIDRGVVVEDPQPAQIVSNGIGNQLLIASAGHAYIFNLKTAAFTEVLLGPYAVESGPGRADQIGMLDGYFLAFNRSLSLVRFSDLSDGLTWDPNDFFRRGIAPDKWQAMTVNQGKIWLIGEHTGEVWWDTGGSTVPFQPIPSSVFSYGIAAPWSLVSVGDSVRWLSQTRDGDGIVVSAKGYRPERISDHATEHTLAQYREYAHIDDCEGMTYQNLGHTYTIFRFPSADATRVFDDATNLWHERAAWDGVHDKFHVWRPRAHTQAFGLHLVVDADSDMISQLDQNTHTDLDALIRRVRITPTLHGEGERVFLDRVELYVEPGLAQQPGFPYDNPKVMLQVSYDGGKTWSNERHGSAGLVGQYQRRVAWPRCGSGWSVVVKISCTDSVPWNLIDCHIDATGFAQARDQATAQ